MRTRSDLHHELNIDLAAGDVFLVAANEIHPALAERASRHGRGVAEIVDKLTMIGLEVESVEDKAALLKPFVIASVISAERHPNADRLRVCMVDIGPAGDGKPIQVVCGAPNARAGMKGVFSAPGTFIPGKNMTLEVGKIRGVESRGMLLSEAELMVSDDHDGIIDLPADAPVGKPYVEWAGAAEPVIEINLTPNRPDCTGVTGIARDLGATLIGDYKENAPKRVDGKFPCPVKVTIEIARAVSRLRPTPGQGRQERPLARLAAKAADGHRLAADQCAGRHHQFHHLRPRPAAACVRRRQGARQSHRTPRQKRRDAHWRSTARPTRSIPAMCVIADENAVESLSGIMGGEATGCSEKPPTC